MIKKYIAFERDFLMNRIQLILSFYLLLLSFIKSLVKIY